MTAKPTSAAGYNRSQIDLVKATCLYVATKLGDLLGDLVVVGGLAPSLLIPHEKLPANTEPHVGTLDLDLGLTLALLADKRYQKMSERLRRAGFEPDVNEVGNKTRQRWRLADQADMKVDFLIPQSESNKHGGTIQNIDKDLAALITPGLELAFKDFEKVLLTGKTVRGEEASREIKVCGPGAYVILKTLAFRSRGENKDAYDLYYVVRNFGVSTDDVAARLRPLLVDRFSYSE